MKRKVIIPIFVYLILSFILAGLILIINIDLTKIDNVRNYYSIIGSISSTIVGTTGLMLGVFYYFDKERRSKTLILKQAIEEYDIIVRKILNINFSTEDELRELRLQLQCISDRINFMIEPTTKFLQLNDTKLKALLKINSVVDKSHVIKDLSYSDFKQIPHHEIAIDSDAYEQVLKEALIVCYGELR